MASVDVIFVAIVILGIIYMYINSRQYLVREGFECITINGEQCNLNCVQEYRQGNKPPEKRCIKSGSKCRNLLWKKC